MSKLTTLDGVTTGKYIVTTAGGTEHHIDFDSRTLVRKAAQGHEWDGTGMGFGPVTPDGEPVHFASIGGVKVGGRMLVENGIEWRISSDIISIQKIP